MAFENRDYLRNDDRPNIQFALPKFSPLFAALAGISLIVFIVSSLSPETRAAANVWLGLRFNGGTAFWQPWRFVTYQYVHANAVHLFFNFLTLFWFLPWMEGKWGRPKTFAFYTLGGIASGLTFGLFGLLMPAFFYGNLIGASGSVLAILGACALFFGDRAIAVFFIPMTVRGLAVLMGAFFLLSSLADRDFSDAAHLGGLVFGFFAPYVFGPKIRDLSDGWRRRQESRIAQQAVATEAEIDRILAKVGASGMHSLTRAEQRTLRDATARQNRETAGRR